MARLMLPGTFMRTIGFLLACTCVLSAACSSLDDDIFPRVERAAIEVDGERPDDLASLDVEIELEAGPTADREVVLAGVSLIDPEEEGWTLPVELQFPAGFDTSFGPDEARTTELDNAGTTNEQLLPACERSSWLQVQITYADEPGTMTFGHSEIQLACEP